MLKVVVNAGHTASDSGYPDHGASGSYSYEGDITKAVAEIVVEDLAKVGYKALFVQEDNLTDVCDISNGFNADVFVSIHCNSVDNAPDAKGTETFYHVGSDEGPKLAQCIQNQLVNTMQSVDRGIKVDTSLYPRGLAVLRNTDAYAALVELGFISNLTEEYYMNTHIPEMAHAVARGITDYFAVKG